MWVAMLAALTAGAILAGIGSTRLVVGFPTFVAASRAGHDTLARAIPLVAALRFALAGLALIGLGMGGIFAAPWIVTLALVFGLEELYETTAVLGILRWAQRRGWPRPAAFTSVSYPVMGADFVPPGWWAGAVGSSRSARSSASSLALGVPRALPASVANPAS